MNLQDLWSASFDPEIFLEMAPSLAALGTLLAVLFLPKIQQTLTDRKNLRTVQKELYDNKRQMKIILELWNRKK